MYGHAHLLAASAPRCYVQPCSGPAIVQDDDDPNRLRCPKHGLEHARELLEPQAATVPA